jgi:hypothetical protein
MGDLRLRMHAGVGAAGALHQDFFARQRFNAAVSTPCTVSWSAWICQPAKGCRHIQR